MSATPRRSSTWLALAAGLIVVSGCSGDEPSRSVVTYPILDTGIGSDARFTAGRQWGEGRAIAAAVDDGFTAVVTTAGVFVAEAGAAVRRVAPFPGMAADVEIDVVDGGTELVIGQADRVWTIDVSTGNTTEFVLDPAAGGVRDVFTLSGQPLVSTTGGVFAIGPTGLESRYDGITPAGSVGVAPAAALVPVAGSADVYVDDGSVARRVTLALDEGEVVTDASVSTGGVLAVASSPAGDPFESNDRINLVEATSGAVLVAIEVGGPLQASAWTTTDDHVVVADSETFRVWTLDGIDLADVALPTDRPVVATLHVSGGVMTVHADGTVVRWPPETWVPEIVAEGGTSLVDVDVAGDGATMASVDFYGGVAWRSGTDGQVLDQDARFAVGETTDVSFSSDGRLAFSSSVGNAVVLDGEFGEIATLRVVPDRRNVGAVQFSDDGSVLVTGVAERVGDIAYDDTIVAWDGTSEVLRRDGDEADVAGCGLYNSRISFSSDGRWMAASSHDFAVDIYDVTSKQLVTSIDGPASILDLAFMPDDGRLVVAYDDATVSVREPDGFTETAAFETTMGGYQALSPLGASGLLVVADVVGDVSIVRASDGVAVEPLGSTGARLSTLAVSDDGSLVAAPDASGGIIVWSTAEGSEIARLEGHSGAVTGLAFSSDARTLASASRDGTVRSWTLETA